MRTATLRPLMKHTVEKNKRRDYIVPPTHVLAPRAPSGALAEGNGAASGIASVAATLPEDCAGLRFDQALARVFPQHSRSRLADWAKAGRALLDGLPADAKRKVWGGERVTLAPEPDRSETAFAPEEIPLPIVHEDDAILVIDKPAGLVVHPGSGNWQGTMLNALLAHCPALSAVPRAGIVHRLDKDTSGLLVVAKTLAAQTALVRELQTRTMKREYRAVVHGRVERAGKVEAPIGRHPTARTRMAVSPQGKPAITHYRVVKRTAAATLLECSLETGRTHQIRVHLASIGHPLVGDPVYGRRRASDDARRASLRATGGHTSSCSPIFEKSPVGGGDLLFAFPRQALHAARLGLVHPASGVPSEWLSPLPADMAALVAGLD